MTSLASRLYQPGDEQGIVELYNSITGRNRTLDQHRWEWLHTPEGQGHIWVITEGASKIVGHHGLIPIRATYFGRSILLGKTENTIIHPKYKGTGIYFLYERRFLREAKEKFDILYTTSGEGTPAKLRKMLGYKPVGSHATYVKFTSFEAVRRYADVIFSSIIPNKLPRCSSIVLFGVTFPFLIWHVHRNQRKLAPVRIQSDIAFDNVADELDRFWLSNRRNYGITPERNSSFLRWRIASNPYCQYEILIARNNGDMVGYLIYRISKNRIPKGIVVDVVASRNDATIINSLLYDYIRVLRLRNVPVAMVPTILSKSSINKVLTNNGFLLLQQFDDLAKRILVRGHTESSVLLAMRTNNQTDEHLTFNPLHWYYTDILTEGVD